MADAVEAEDRSESISLEILLEKSGSGTCFSPNAEGFPVFHTHLYLTTAVTRTIGRSLVRIFRQNTDLSDIWGRWTEE
jgi:hypothetical protein